jgi:hypothetical protein
MFLNFYDFADSFVFKFTNFLKFVWFFGVLIFLGLAYTDEQEILTVTDKDSDPYMALSLYYYWRGVRRGRRGGGRRREEGRRMKTKRKDKGQRTKDKGRGMKEDKGE